MILSKSATILVNVALIILVAHLAKSFFAVPKNANDAMRREYKIAYAGFAPTPGNHEDVLNRFAKDGRTLVNAEVDFTRGGCWFFLER